MSGGSRERESPTDVQCSNCGRFYSAQGIDNHESSCGHPEWAEPLVPLETREDREELTQPSPGDDAPDTQEAKTDGGGLGLSGPPEPSETEDVEPEEVDEPETVDCSSCGGDLEATEEELRERFGSDPFKCGNCGAKLRVGA